MKLKTELIEIEDRLDKLNGLFGKKDAYCIFCKTIKYNSQVGLIHNKICIIQQLRDTIKNG